MAPFRIEPRFVKQVSGARELLPWFDFATNENPIGEVWLTGDD